MKAQAHASARVDVPTARVFPAWTKESNTSASFCVNARTCAHQSTDVILREFQRECLDMRTIDNRRDLETKSGMLGYVHRDHELTLVEKTVISVISVTSVIFIRIYFWNYCKSVIFVI